LSHGQYTRIQVGDFFKKIFSIICPPIADLIQMAQDGTEKIRDEHVGDHAAAAHDKANLKKDGRQFGGDFGQLVATTAAECVMPEAGAALKVAEEAKAAGTAIKTGVKGAKAGSKAAKSGGKEGSATRDLLPGGGTPEIPRLTDLIMSKLTGAPKDSTWKESVHHVKAKVKAKVEDLKEQFKQPNNDNLANSPEDVVPELLDLMTLMQSAQAAKQQRDSEQRDSEQQDSERQDSKKHVPKQQQHDLDHPAPPASPSAASHQWDKATA
jgi:hypothetical protein